MGKKKKYSEEELRELGHGERLAKLRTILGFKTRTSFALSINYSASTLDAVEDFKRPISKNLLQAIDKIYESRYDKNWLLYGHRLKLLTIKKETEEQKVEESKLKYRCKNCDEKNRQIKLLTEELNNLRKDYIECLKELARKKNASG